MRHFTSLLQKKISFAEEEASENSLQKINDKIKMKQKNKAAPKDTSFDISFAERKLSHFLLCTENTTRNEHKD